MTLHLYGIRHHGPGSSRSLLSALERLNPDLLLVEGPPEGESVLDLLAHTDLEPPVALLVYAQDNPSKAAFYPFAHFSPEYVSLRWALERGIAARFMDLPVGVGFALDAEGGRAREREGEIPDTGKEMSLERRDRPADALGDLARAAGFEDFERWWEWLVEARGGEEGFDAVLEAMTALRADHPAPTGHEALREGHMRQCIRVAHKEGFSRIAVVCGAWHAPLLEVGGSTSLRVPTAQEDAAQLGSLPRQKTTATWIPWTYSRLSSASGYGAGIASPAWYAHLYDTPEQVTERWMTRVARLLREQNLDASSAHIIEAVRLARAVASVRGRPLPDLSDLLEAAEAVFASGNPHILKLIERELVVGEKLGRVPEGAPTVPLERDLERQLRTLRLKREALERDIDLDLRKDTDLERSKLLHRLTLLGVEWGVLLRTGGGQSTFHELWRLQWKPELALNLIEAARYGAEVSTATLARLRECTLEAELLGELSALLDSALLADLPEGADLVLARLDALAATSSDVPGLLSALPPLARVRRYGNVRRTDRSAVERTVTHLLTRACLNLPLACAALDDEAAGGMQKHLVRTHEAVSLLERPDLETLWLETLERLSRQGNVHGLVAGRSLRLLLERGFLEDGELVRRFSLALSSGNPPAAVAAWLEGFLGESGLLLLHDDALWGVLDGWVAGLSEDAFAETVPMLRRTFSAFAPAERRDMGERAKRGSSLRPGTANALEHDWERGQRVLPLLERLLGIAEGDHA